MGCGQSKINLYPRRNKNGGKGNSSKKSGGAEKEADEEEGSTAAGNAGASAGTPEDAEEDPDRGKHILPLAAQSQSIEISASQEDFFKMLDEKIEMGKDYDSSSETEIQMEAERRKALMVQWRSASQSSQSSQPSPPTPARRRLGRPGPPPPERQHSPGAGRRCFRPPLSLDHHSPPPRRAHSAQSSYHQHERQMNGDREWHDPNKSPIKRPQSAGASWKNGPKVAPFPHPQKPKRNLDANENQKASSLSLDQITGSSQSISQITYNPTFQTHSPAHSVKTTPQQPYIAQIITYPMSQQVTPPSPPKFIAPPEEYQDSMNNVAETKLTPTSRQSPAGQVSPQPPIYYIHGNASTSPTPDLAQQRQQTAIHLQQYVAMKQAQQQMYTYLQRGPHTVYPNVDYATQRPIEPNRMYEQGEEGFIPPYAGHPAMRPHSAPTPVGVVRPMSLTPGFAPVGDTSQMLQMSVWSHMTPVVSSMSPWVQGQAHHPEPQYYHQGQFVQNMYRPNSAGSAGTLTRYPKDKPLPTDFSSANVGSKNNQCQSINLVRQKPVGQIVSLGGQELTVCHNSSDSPSPASVSTDSGVSPGNSGSSSKNSVFSAISSGNPQKDTQTISNCTETKSKKKSVFTRALKNSKSLDST